MMYRIKTTRQATADRDHCFDYIAERSPDGALRWLEAYEMAAGSLLAPLRSFAPENPDHERQNQRQNQKRQNQTPMNRGLRYFRISLFNVWPF